MVASESAFIQLMVSDQLATEKMKVNFYFTPHRICDGLFKGKTKNLKSLEENINKYLCKLRKGRKT